MFEVFQIHHFVTSAQYNHQKYQQFFFYEQPLSEIQPEFSAFCHIQIKCPRIKGRLQIFSVRSPHQSFNSQYILWGPCPLASLCLLKERLQKFILCFQKFISFSFLTNIAQDSEKTCCMLRSFNFLAFSLQHCATTENSVSFSAPAVACCL